MSAITTTEVSTDSDNGRLIDVQKTFAQIVEHNKKACEGIGHMIEAGKLLTLLKERIPHGQFIKMSLSETKLSRSTISRYMQMAANAPRVGHLKSGRDAMETIAKLIQDSAPKKSPPASHSSPRPAATVIMDAELVEPETSHASITQEPQDDEEEPLVVDGIAPKQERIPKWIPDDAERLWLLAKTDLDKILQSDKSREKVFNTVIAYAHSRLDQNRDALAAIVGTIPRLTQDEIKSLIETLKNRLA